MGDTFVMSARQAAELDHAFERNGVTPVDVKLLSSGDLLAKLLPAIRGFAEVVITKDIVDLDAEPFVPDGWKVEEHIKGGQFEFDPAKVALHLDEEQKEGGVIVGNEFRKKLKGRPVYNANLLEFCLAHPNLIPEEWKGKAIFFWGTIYRLSDGDLYVRYLVWRGGRWLWSYDWLDGRFDGNDPAAVPAK